VPVGSPELVRVRINSRPTRGAGGGQSSAWPGTRSGHRRPPCSVSTSGSARTGRTSPASTATT